MFHGHRLILWEEFDHNSSLICLKITQNSRILSVVVASFISWEEFDDILPLINLN
jgi:hypothetical protein